MFLSIGQASRYLGISISTLRRWEKMKKLIPSYKTFGNHRRYDLNSLKEISLGIKHKNTSKKVIAYARVSSHDQKKDLSRQVKRLTKVIKTNQSNIEVIQDLGSGMNYKKRGLKRLIKMILAGEISKIVLTHKDRLLRFGSEIIFLICDYFGVQIQILDKREDISDEQLLAFDVLEIITVFSARLYGKRSHSNRKALA